MSNKRLSLRKFVREMDLEEGDQFILSGYTSNKNIHADMFRLNEELGTNMKISQKEIIMLDPVDLSTEKGWLITVTERGDKEKKFKTLGRKKQ